MLDLTRGALAALSLLTVLTAATASAQGGDPRMAEARARFDPAVAIFEQGDYAGALAEFERIYQLLEGHSRRFFVLYNIARCQEALFRYDAAIETYQRYLREGGAGTEQEQDARQRTVELERRLATVVIESNVSAEVWLDDRLVGQAPGTIRVTAGSHRIELRARGYAPERQPLQVAARTQETLRFTLDRTGSGLSPAFFLTGAGLTLVAAGIGAGFGISALGEHGTLSGRLANSHCAVLNELNGIAADACELYQCTPAARCELQARDDDRDATPSRAWTWTSRAAPSPAPARAAPPACAAPRAPTSPPRTRPAWRTRRWPCGWRTP